MGFSMLKHKIVIFGAVFFCLMMVLFPEISATASKNAMHLWINAIVPTLFPFIVMTCFIQRIGMLDRMPIGVYPFVMAILSGYPMGAKVAGDAWRSGCLDEDELRRVLSYSMVTGPAFILGAVGMEFFHSSKLGWILVVSHYGGALLNGCLSGSFSREITGKTPVVSKMGKSYAASLTDSILDAFQAIGMILAYIMMFMILTDLLQFSGIFSFFSRDYMAALLKGILEMTVGCNAIQSCNCSLMVKMVCTSFVLSFGGLSVAGQSMSMLAGCPVTLEKILSLKLRHGAISGILTFTICAFVV